MDQNEDITLTIIPWSELFEDVFHSIGISCDLDVRRACSTHCYFSLAERYRDISHIHLHLNKDILDQ